MKSIYLTFRSIKLWGISLFIIWLVSIPGRAQTFSFSTGSTIPDDGSWIEFPIEVSGLTSNLVDTFGLEHVCFSINHTYVSDLEIRLVNPTGQEFSLANRVGGDGDNFVNTVVGSRIFPSISTNWAPFTGTYSSQQNLGLANQGQTGNGTWKLKIRDLYPQDQGFLTNWCITFSNSPCSLYPFQSSNLPIFIINTRGQFISDEPKVNGYFQVVNQGNSIRNYTSDSASTPKIPLGIETRGSSSQSFPKKSYGFEIRNPAGEDSSIALLDMPAQSDWILSANYSDKTFMRNAFAYHLARQMGAYAPRTRYVELIVNEEYQGIYVLMEKIKRDPNRVNIAKLKSTDTSGSNLTGGYIIKIDKETGNDNDHFISQFNPSSNSQGQKIRFLYDYPKAEDLHPRQKEYIRTYVDSFETALWSGNFANPETGYKRFIDLPSFIDNFIINEWSKNTDGYRISSYFTKPKSNQNGGKLVAGPVWDYDIAWRNANYCKGENTAGWEIDFPTECPDDYFQPPFWWKSFRQDPAFNTELRCRWNDLTSDIMPQPKRNLWIDSVKNYLSEALVRNFEVWPILGQYVWPNPNPIPPDYEGEVLSFKNWLTNRQNWITGNIGGVCLVGNRDLKTNEEPEIGIFPNPAHDFIKIFGVQLHEVKNAWFINSLGQTIERSKTGDDQFSVMDLPSGLYRIRIPEHPEFHPAFFKY